VKPWVLALPLSAAASNLVFALLVSGPSRQFGFAAAALGVVGAALLYLAPRAK
jgi:hypothetical protein